MTKSFGCGGKKYQMPQAFWEREDFRWRVRTKIWTAMLIQGCDTIIKDGITRHLQAKKLGYGVLEISLVPLPPVRQSTGSLEINVEAFLKQ